MQIWLWGLLLLRVELQAGAAAGATTRPVSPPQRERTLCRRPSPVCGNLEMVGQFSPTSQMTFSDQMADARPEEDGNMSDTGRSSFTFPKGKCLLRRRQRKVGLSILCRGIDDSNVGETLSDLGSRIQDPMNWPSFRYVTSQFKDMMLSPWPSKTAHRERSTSYKHRHFNPRSMMITAQEIFPLGS